MDQEDLQSALRESAEEVKQRDNQVRVTLRRIATEGEPRSRDIACGALDDLGYKLTPAMRRDTLRKIASQGEQVASAIAYAALG